MELWNVPDAVDDTVKFLEPKMKKKTLPPALTALRSKDKMLFDKIKQALVYNPDKRATAKEMYQLF